MGRSALTCCSPLCTNRPVLLEQRKYRLDGCVKVLSESGPQQRELREFCAFVAGWYDNNRDAFTGLGDDGTPVKREEFKQYAAKIGFTGDGGMVFDSLDVDNTGVVQLQYLRTQLLDTISSLEPISRPSAQSRGTANRSTSRSQLAKSEDGGRQPSVQRGRTISKEFKNRPSRAASRDGSPTLSADGTQAVSETDRATSGTSQSRRPGKGPPNTREQTEASALSGETDTCDKARTNGVAEASTRSSLHQTDDASRAESRDPEAAKRAKNAANGQEAGEDGAQGSKDGEIRKGSKGQKKGRRASRDKSADSADGTESVQSMQSFAPKEGTGDAEMFPNPVSKESTDASGGFVREVSGQSDQAPVDSTEMPVVKAPVAVPDTDGIPKIDANDFVMVRPHPYKRCDADEVDERERLRSFVFKGRLFEVPLLPLYKLDEDEKQSDRGANKGAAWTMAKSKVLGQKKDKEG
mmetsp:Transcript_135041/g.248445  ORF Transcript_135041/g.248445 Transcript_135041/m.248445 type:complete len:466 (+) Transcript_135041:15-1412(+)